MIHLQMGRLGGVDEEVLGLGAAGSQGSWRLREVGLLGAAEAGKLGADEPGVDWG